MLKLFKRSNDPDYQGNPTAQTGAVQRLKIHQTKLAAFPKNLPAHVVAPINLAYGSAQGGEITGYTMRFLDHMEVLLSLGDRRYRELGGIDANQTLGIFANLHEMVQAIHKAKVVIGDFNDLNVLFDAHGEAWVVDADSMQFGKFFCQTFTARFVDPLCCSPSELVLSRPHNNESDWYAYSTMLFQTLLYVGPYGGVHRPKTGKRLQHDARVLQRISVFNDEVQYPRPANPLNHLPDDVLEHFQRVYEKDLRNPFPLNLIKSMRWTKCLNCGAEHARPKCPECAAPGVVKETIVKRGTVTARRVFQTHGSILQATVQGDTLRYLFHERDSFRREGDREVIPGQLDPELRFRIKGEATLLGKRNTLLVLAPGHEVERLTTDTVNNLSIFDSNERNHYWISGGQLTRNGRIGSEYLGNVLSNRTLFWVGPQFGFGFYQAGQLMTSFVFNTNQPGINDQVPIPVFPGQLIDATCVFSTQRAWFMTSTSESGRLVNRCYVIDTNGDVLAQAETVQGDGTWLGSGIRGRFASGGSLYAATDEGIVRVSVDNGLVNVEQTFPDTVTFVDATTQLLPGKGGIYAVNLRNITLLTIQ